MKSAVKSLEDTKWPYLSRGSNPPFIRNKLYSTCQDRNIRTTPESCESVVIHTCDPAGNWISITNRLSPFGGEVFQAPVAGSSEVHGGEATLKRHASKFSSLVSFQSQAEDLTLISVAILTSGGDSSGMNAAVRASVRTTLQMKHIPYIVYGGYKGSIPPLIMQRN